MKLAMRDVAVTRAGRAVLAGVNLTIDAGERVVIAGASGAGKSTLLAALLGAVRCDRGVITFDGVAVAPAAMPRDRRLLALGWVQQDAGASLHARWSARTCVADPLRVQGVGRDAAEARAALALTSVGLEARWFDARPHQLSGGQQQRVAIARALAQGAEVLLLDEPSSALDDASAADLAALLRALSGEGLAVLAVTHDAAFAAALGATVYDLVGGRLVASGDGDAFAGRERAAWAAVAAGRSQ